jgi:molybdopterin-guanine dinucleotide biosynthesis protein A
MHPGAGVSAGFEDAAGMVLAGGQSSRMGRDKALVQLHGSPLVELAVRTMHEADLPVSITGGRAALAAYAPMIDDEIGLGPLSGIVKALEATAARWAVFMPIDLPLLPPSLLRLLLDQARIRESLATLAAVNGFVQTFPVVLDRAILPSLKVELAAGRRGCFAGFQAAAAALDCAVTVVPVETLVQAGQVEHPAGLPASWWFLNVNSQDDLRRAERFTALGQSRKLDVNARAAAPEIAS